jgi:hypothetical protein
VRVVITDQDVLRAVSTLSIHAYLKSQGWLRGDDLGDRGVIYHSASGVEVFAPGTDKLGDYAQSVEAVLSAIAATEERDETAVFRDLASSDRDLLRFRAPQADDDGSIDLNAGVDLVQQSRDALLAAACSAVSAQRYYRSGSNAKANDYLKTVKLGQTEHGSFVVTLHSPVPPQLETGQQSLWPEQDLANEPFGRQVTRTLANAVDSLISAIGEVGRGADIAAFERVVTRGVSANLCAAIAKFVTDGQGLDFSLTWARTRPSTEPRHRAVFSPSDAEVLGEAARVLKNKGSFSNEVLEGYVTGLNRDVIPEDGRVKLKTFVDGQARSVTVVLPRGLYSKATEAHKSKLAIRLEGDLEFEGQRWYLRTPRNLEVIEEKETDE